LIQVRAGDQKGGDAAAVVSDINPVQAAAHAQQKCAPEQIGHFDGSFQRDLTSFQVLDFFGEMR
jgi:hypothetical protein